MEFFTRVVEWGTWMVFKAIATCTGGIHIENINSLPRNGAFMIVSNHKSLADPFWIKFALLSHQPKRKMWGWGKIELFQINKIVTWYMNTMRVIPVNRKAKEFRLLYKKSVEILRKGDILGVFPQGTRHGFRIEDGAYIVANRAKVPVIAVKIQYRRHTWLKPRIDFIPITHTCLKTKKRFETVLRQMWNI